MNSTQLGPPKADAFRQGLAKLILKLVGWRIQATFPKYDKSVAIFTPHTSNWDGLYMLSGIYAMGIKPQILAKDQLFLGPLKYFSNWLGLIPVDRSHSHNVVEQIVNSIQKREQVLLGIAPEGSRSKKDYWKSGFYHIAYQAGLPLLFAFLDYKDKVVGMAPGIFLTGDMEADLGKIRDFYKDFTAKNPEASTPIRFKPKKD